MNHNTVMGMAIPTPTPHDYPRVQVLPATIYDQFMMAAITGILARGNEWTPEYLGQQAARIADAAMRHRA